MPLVDTQRVEIERFYESPAAFLPLAAVSGEIELEAGVAKAG